MFFENFDSIHNQKINAQINKADRLIIIGLVMEHAFFTNRPLIEARLRNRKSLEVLTVLPTPDVLRIIMARDKSQERRKTTAIRMAAIFETYQQLKGVGDLRVNLIEYPIFFGGYIADPGVKGGEMLGWLYQYKIDAAPRPKFYLSASEPDFDWFWKETTDMLDDAELVNDFGPHIAKWKELASSVSLS